MPQRCRKARWSWADDRTRFSRIRFCEAIPIWYWQWIRQKFTQGKWKMRKTSYNCGKISWPPMRKRDYEYALAKRGMINWGRKKGIKDSGSGAGDFEQGPRSNLFLTRTIARELWKNLLGNPQYSESETDDWNLQILRCRVTKGANLELNLMPLFFSNWRPSAIAKQHV